MASFCSQNQSDWWWRGEWDQKGGWRSKTHDNTNVSYKMAVGVASVEMSNSFTSNDPDILLTKGNTRVRGEARWFGLKRRWTVTSASMVANRSMAR